MPGGGTLLKMMEITTNDTLKEEAGEDKGNCI